jgi:uncharacterized protein (TIGR03086 family)
MFDLEPATSVLSNLVARVSDDQLAGPTPCTETSVGGMLDHIRGLSVAFAVAATKETLRGDGPGPSADANNLGPDWRTTIPQRLGELAGAWRDPDAWAGMTRAGGLNLPAEAAAAVVADELVVHGWDLAVATGQPFRAADDLVQVAYGFARATVDSNPQGTPGLYGPPVTVPDDAPLLDQLLGLTGRDPAWTARAR